MSIWQQRAHAVYPNLAWAIDEIQTTELDPFCLELSTITGLAVPPMRSMLLESMAAYLSNRGTETENFERLAAQDRRLALWGSCYAVRSLVGTRAGFEAEASSFLVLVTEICTWCRKEPSNTDQQDFRLRGALISCRSWEAVLSDLSAVVAHLIDLGTEEDPALRAKHAEAILARLYVGVRFNDRLFADLIDAYLDAFETFPTLLEG